MVVLLLLYALPYLGCRRWPPGAAAGDTASSRATLRGGRPGGHRPRTGGRAWPDALAHPVSVVLLAGLTARSFRRAAAAGALTWKGRPLP